ncbi:MAG: hypothetical protein QXD62_01575 [Candidatus Woesearchaeota archaeon]
MLAKSKSMANVKIKNSKKVEDYLIQIETKVVESISNDPDFLRVVFELRKKSNYSEFELAEKLKLDIMKVRRILYKLFEHGLLFWRRKKDRQKGWYVYYWTIREDQFIFYYKTYLEKRINYFKKKIEFEEKTNFFMCPNFCMRATYEDAINLNFTCPECGSVFVEQDNSKTISNLRKQLEDLENELTELERSELIKYIAKEYDKWTSSENLFAKTKKRGVEKERDFLDILLNDIAPETVITDVSEEEEPSGY